MGVGKYSPTVSAAYRADQQWWEKNGGGFGNGNNPDSDMDNDGFDSYGYGPNDGPDRAGHTELEYMSGEWVQYEETEQYEYPLAESVYSDWGFNKETGKPVSRYS